MLQIYSFVTRFDFIARFLSKAANLQIKHTNQELENDYNNSKQRLMHFDVKNVLDVVCYYCNRSLAPN